MEKPELLEISFSHYCEKVRWALNYHQIEFTRCPHLPLLTRVISRWRGGLWHTVPVLFVGKELVAGSQAILAWADTHGRRPALLKTQDGDELEIKRWTALFDKKLGPATRRIFYFHILDETQLIKPILQSSLSFPEKTLSTPFLPLIRAVIRNGLKIDSSGAERSRRDLNAVWHEVETALADGRRYLVADRFSAADLTFAALAAPILLPEAYDVELPAFEKLPRSAQEEINTMRNTKAGQFALDLYRQKK